MVLYTCFAIKKSIGLTNKQQMQTRETRNWESQYQQNQFNENQQKVIPIGYLPTIAKLDCILLEKFIVPLWFNSVILQMEKS